MPKTVRLCPKCRSVKLHLLTNVSGWLAPKKFECKECGYCDSFFVEVDIDELKKMKEEKEKK